MKKLTFKLFNLNTTFKSILLYTLSPCLIMVVFSFAFLFYSINSQIDIHTKQSTNTINSLHQAVEYKIKSISSVFNLYNDDKNLLAALTDDSNKASSVNKIQTTLHSISSSFAYIDSIVVYDKGNNAVISTDAIMTISDFFNNYSYADYSADYWYNYKYSISKPRFLPPTSVEHNKGKKLIVPLVYSGLGQNYLNKLIIFNIDFGMILSDVKSDINSDDTKISVVNRLTNQSFSTTDINHPQTVSSEFSNIFKKNNTYNGIHYLNGEKSLIVYSSPTRSALSYSCFTSIPYTSIIGEAFQSTTLLFVLIFISSSCAVILAYIFSKKNICAYQTA